MTLSIIIPVYNVEPYLADCLNSVLACDLTDCEIILSQRESLDCSLKICEKYRMLYPTIRTLMQDGKGLSNARNSAMRIARGKYILFIDSDDRVDSEVLDKLIAHIRAEKVSSDVIVTDYCRIEYPAKKKHYFNQIGELTPDQYGMHFFPQMLRHRQCFWNVWRYIYRRNFLEEHRITFPENMFSEDVDFTTNVFLAEPEIVFSHSPYYLYHVGRGDSLMDRPTLKRLRETIFILSNCIERLRSSTFRYADEMIAQFQFEYILNLALSVEIQSDDRKTALTLYKGWEWVLRDSIDPLVRAITKFLHIFGIRATARALHILKMIRRRFRGRKQICSE